MSRYLVDTHAALWWLADDPRISPAARAAISDAGNELLVSVASLWEIAIKRQLGKLKAPDDLPDILIEEGFGFLPVTARHSWKVQELPLHHRDPFDRLLIAQSQVLSVPLATADDELAAYDIEAIRV